MLILFVCTANICRSPAAEQVTALELARRKQAATSLVHPEDREGAAAVLRLLGQLELASAGVAAMPGSPGCYRAPALAFGAGAGHRSQRVTDALIDSAGLILTAERAHRSAVAAQRPQSRPRTFTIRQAGRLSQWVIGPDGPLGDSAGQPAPLAEAGADPVAADPSTAPAPPLPPRDSPAERLAWFVAELDAARGQVSSAPTETPPDGNAGPGAPRPRSARLPGWRHGKAANTTPGGPERNESPTASTHPDDILDPHIYGYQLHQAVHQQILLAVGQIADAFEQLALA